MSEPKLSFVVPEPAEHHIELARVWLLERYGVEGDGAVDEAARALVLVEQLAGRFEPEPEPAPQAPVPSKPSVVYPPASRPENGEKPEPTGGESIVEVFSRISAQVPTEVWEAMRRERVRTFKMVRNADESGVSGTGTILVGAQFHTGQVVVCWLTDTPSLGIYQSYADFVKLHITSHPTNKTEVHWADGKMEQF